MEQKKRNRFGEFINKRKPQTKMDVVRLIVLLISVPVFIYSAGQLIHRFYRYGYEDKQMEDIVAQKPVTNNPFEEIKEEEDENLFPELPYKVYEGKDSRLVDGILGQYRDLYAKNEDLAGWMIFPGFDSKPIDYPILYSGDNDFYLHRDFNKKDSYAGSLFFDGNHTPLHMNPMKIDRNYVIYGHAMKNKSMFGHLTDYWGNEEALRNTTIYIDLLNTRLEYEVISTFLCAPNYNYRQINFLSDQQYLDYLNTMVSKSQVDFGATVTADDKIITLSTCYRTTRRTAIIAKLVRQFVYTDIPDEDYDPGDNQVALPTHIPLEIPSPTPRPDSESDSDDESGDSFSEGSTGSTVPGSDPSGGTLTSDLSDSSDPDISPTPTEAPPDPDQEVNLIKNPEVNSDGGHWLAAAGAEFEYDEEHVIGKSSGRVTSAGAGRFAAYQDVSDILKDKGSGSYSAVASISAPASEEGSDFRFVLLINFDDEGDSSSVAYISATESVQASDSWKKIGGIDKYLFLEGGQVGDNHIDLEGREIISAFLYIESLDGDLTSFNFDEVRFFKKAVPDETTDPDPTPTVEPTPEPTAPPEESGGPASSGAESSEGEDI